LLLSRAVPNAGLFVVDRRDVLQGALPLERLVVHEPDALVKEWTNITRSIALAPPLAAPAVIMNLVRPLVQGWERMDDDQ
jgi:hypothetical protein